MTSRSRRTSSLSPPRLDFPPVASQLNCGNEGGLFGLDKHHFVVGISGQEVFSEQALGQSPVCGEQFSMLEDGVNPVYFAGCGGVFDTVSGSRVVFHYLSCATVEIPVYLKIYDVRIAGNSEGIFFYKAFYYQRVYNSNTSVNFTELKN